MKKSFLYPLIYILLIAAPRVFADTVTNSDFNPFPQMEQDVNNPSDEAVPAQQQNDDWPPANDEAKGNSEDDHE